MMIVSCRYAPQELFAGFGKKVEVLNPTVTSFNKAECCGHANLCSYAKALMETVMQSGVKELVLTDCCDAVRRSYDILKAEGNLDFLYLLPLPHKNSEAEILRFAKSLQQLKEEYSSYLGISFDLSKAMDALKAEVEKKKEEIDGNVIRLAGAHGGQSLVSTMEHVFSEATVVDETCSGNRKLCGTFKEETFFEDYARILLSQPIPCMRMWFNGNRSLLNEKRPLGTVYHTIQFCDYYSFDYINEKKDSVVPIINIETESIPNQSGQLLTRLEAFKEELHMERVTKKIKQGYVMGIDIGSTSTDFIIMNEKKEILASAILPTGVQMEETLKQGKDAVYARAHLKESDISLVVTTGYGRKTSGLSDASVTEITCHAKGAHYLYPNARTVIDIGGQDSKVIRMDENGKVIQFVMNDKCAAGTGRFLEAQARALNLSLEEMSRLGMQWRKEVSISSMCTVFAESEVISLIAEKNAAEDIIHGLNEAIASKTYSLIQRVSPEKEYIMTGGVAQNKGVVTCLEEKLKAPVYVSEKSQLCGAIGAALLGLE